MTSSHAPCSRRRSSPQSAAPIRCDQRKRTLGRRCGSHRHSRDPCSSSWSNRSRGPDWTMIRPQTAPHVPPASSHASAPHLVQCVIWPAHPSFGAPCARHCRSTEPSVGVRLTHPAPLVCAAPRDELRTGVLRTDQPVAANCARALHGVRGAPPPPMRTRADMREDGGYQTRRRSALASSAPHHPTLVTPTAHPRAASAVCRQHRRSIPS